MKHRTKNKENIPLAIDSYKKGMSMTKVEQTYGITPIFFKKLLRERGMDFVNRAKYPIKSVFQYIEDNFSQIICDYNETKSKK